MNPVSEIRSTHEVLRALCAVRFGCFQDLWIDLTNRTTGRTNVEFALRGIADDTDVLVAVSVDLQRNDGLDIGWALARHCRVAGSQTSV